MTILRPMRSRKGLLTLAVISWMLIPLASTPAEALSSCPCNFTSTLLYSKQTAHTFDSRFDFCSIRTDRDVLLGGEASPRNVEEPICRLAFEVGEPLSLVRAPGDGGDAGICSARVDCGNVRLESTDQSLVAPPPGLSSLQTRWVLDERDLKACERELKWLIRLARAPQCEVANPK
jgi:hypothetical protein